jgi:hypothetical protein
MIESLLMGSYGESLALKTIIRSIEIQKKKFGSVPKLLFILSLHAAKAQGRIGVYYHVYNKMKVNIFKIHASLTGQEGPPYAKINNIYISIKLIQLKNWIQTIDFEWQI